METGDELKAKPYDGPPCPHRCGCCPEEFPGYPHEHHWQVEYDRADGSFVSEGFLQCRHCEAERDLPIEDADFMAEIFDWE